MTWVNTRVLIYDRQVFVTARQWWGFPVITNHHYNFMNSNSHREQLAETHLVGHQAQNWTGPEYFTRVSLTPFLYLVYFSVNVCQLFKNYTHKELTTTIHFLNPYSLLWAINISIKWLIFRPYGTHGMFYLSYTYILCVCEKCLFFRNIWGNLQVK